MVRSALVADAGARDARGPPRLPDPAARRAHRPRGPGGVREPALDADVRARHREVGDEAEPRLPHSVPPFLSLARYLHAQHAELACVVAETAKNSGAFEALSALVDHGASVFVGSAPSVVAQVVAPSLVVRREVRTLEVLFASRRQLLEACLPRCLCAALLQIRSVAADAGNRLLSDVASLSAFASGEAISTPPAHRAKEDLLRAHADAVLVLLAAELGGDLSLIHI